MIRRLFYILLTVIIIIGLFLGFNMTGSLGRKITKLLRDYQHTIDKRIDQRSK